MVVRFSEEGLRETDGAAPPIVGRVTPRTLTISPTFPQVAEWNQIAAEQLTVHSTASIVLARYND